MATIDDLKEAIKDTLEQKGVIGKVKAKIRAQIFAALAPGEDEAHPKPEPPLENVVINELIREYLIFNGYRETLSVFLPESGQPAARPFDRSYLSHHLNAEDAGPNATQLPLLYSLVADARQKHTAPAAGGGSSVAAGPFASPLTLPQR